ncbi:hypothetical protein [Streptomyces sp. URMC 129]|uniref:hypothetical protein n=1 Tax=Streptomyces sp. URMC 129 TaxID=3423407 RepID=UPI003F1CF578
MPGAPSPEQRPDTRAGLGRALVGLFVVATALEADTGLGRELFDEVVRRVPGHVGAHGRYLQQAGARHGGSDEAMHAFAYGAMTHAPGGSALGVLAAEAHLESLATSGAQACGYLRNPLVARQLHDAADRSVRHPDYRRGPYWVWEHNMFAMMFALTGERAAARHMFRVLRGRVSQRPWQSLKGNPIRTHRRTRHHSGI